MMYTVQCVLCSEYCVLYTVHCALRILCIVLALCTVWCVLCSVYCVMYIVQRVLCIEYWVLYIPDKSSRNPDAQTHLRQILREHGPLNIDTRLHSHRAQRMVAVSP